MWYHATFEHNLDSIKNIGLQPIVFQRNYWESKNVICLTDDVFAAKSFMEEAETINDDYYDALMETIVVLSIAPDKLNPNHLKNDTNISNGSNDRFKQYHQPIPFSDMNIVT